MSGADETTAAWKQLAEVRAETMAVQLDTIKHLQEEVAKGRQALYILGRMVAHSKDSLEISAADMEDLSTWLQLVCAARSLLGWDRVR
jgi:hypothetical protein